MRFEVEEVKVPAQKEKAMLRRYNSAWKCGVCNKIGSTKRIIVRHLSQAHNISSQTFLLHQHSNN